MIMTSAPYGNRVSKGTASLEVMSMFEYIQADEADDLVRAHDRETAERLELEGQRKESSSD